MVQTLLQAWGGGGTCNESFKKTSVLHPCHREIANSVPTVAIESCTTLCHWEWVPFSEERGGDRVGWKEHAAALQVRPQKQMKLRSGSCFKRPEPCCMQHICGGVVFFSSSKAPILHHTVCHLIALHGGPDWAGGILPRSPALALKGATPPLPPHTHSGRGMWNEAGSAVGSFLPPEPKAIRPGEPPLPAGRAGRGLTLLCDPWQLLGQEERQGIHLFINKQTHTHTHVKIKDLVCQEGYPTGSFETLLLCKVVLGQPLSSPLENPEGMMNSHQEAPPSQKVWPGRGRLLCPEEVQKGKESGP